MSDSLLPAQPSNGNGQPCGFPDPPPQDPDQMRSLESPDINTLTVGEKFCPGKHNHMFAHSGSSTGQGEGSVSHLNAEGKKSTCASIEGAYRGKNIKPSDSNGSRLGTDPQLIDLNSVRNDYIAMASSDFTKKMLFALMGIANSLIWEAAKSVGVFRGCRGEDFELNKQMIPRLWQAEIAFSLALHWAPVHIEKNCQSKAKDYQFTISKRSAGRIVEWLKEQGLLDWKARRFDKASSRKREASRLYTYIDVPMLLILQEGVERHLMAKLHAGLEILPAHRYASSRLLYNNIFPGWGWGRDGERGMNEPLTMRESEVIRRKMHHEWLVEERKRKEAEAATIAQLHGLGLDNLPY